MKNTLKKSMFVVVIIAVFAPLAYSAETSLTQEDRLIRLETKIEIGFQHIDKRFEDMNKRFEDMNKRFEEMRDDMNHRFGEIRDDMNKRFEQIDKRFEQVDKRFDQMFTFLWMLTGIFTTLTMGTIGFAYWDRRTIIKKAKEETIAEIEGEGRLKDMIHALRELSRSNSEVAKVLRQFHIL